MEQEIEAMHGAYARGKPQAVPGLKWKKATSGKKKGGNVCVWGGRNQGVGRTFPLM